MSFKKFLGTTAVAAAVVAPASADDIEREDAPVIIGPEYGNLPAPKGIEDYIQDGYSPLETVQRKITRIPSDDPTSIEAWIKTNEPAVAKDIEHSSNMLSRGPGKDTMLKGLAYITKEFDGQIVETQIIIKDEQKKTYLQDLFESLSLFSYGYSEECFEETIKSSVELAKRSGNLDDVLKIFEDGLWLTELKKDLEFVKVVKDIYFRSVELFESSDVIANDSLKSLYNRTNNNQKNDAFKKAAYELQDILVRAKELDADCVRSVNDTLPFLLERRIKEGDVTKAGNRLLTYVQKLKDQGEVDLPAALTGLQWYGESLDDIFVEKATELHRHFGIVNVARLQKEKGDYTLVDEVLKNTSPEYNADKPVAIVLATRQGGQLLPFDTFSMNSFYGSIISLTNGYKVVVYEVASEKGIADAVRSAHELTGKKAELVMFAGHGNQYGVNMGHDAWQEFRPEEKRTRGTGKVDYGTSKEERLFDAADADTFNSIEQYVEENAQVILYSCETGKGGANEVNMANSTAFGLPGRLIYAPKESCTGAQLEFDESGKLLNVQFESKNRDQKNSRPIGTYRVQSTGKIDVKNLN